MEIIWIKSFPSSMQTLPNNQIIYDLIRCVHAESKPIITKVQTELFVANVLARYVRTEETKRSRVEKKRPKSHYLSTAVCCECYSVNLCMNFVYSFKLNLGLMWDFVGVLHEWIVVFKQKKKTNERWWWCATVFTKDFIRCLSPLFESFFPDAVHPFY